ncbi:MAG: hypothetical protein QOI37_1398 [Chloroflexota bacterium]|jgi:hypothetical protein|nr:hypothetical protein [Chloroflexota bacterium]
MRMYWVRFDEPQYDVGGETAYTKAQVAHIYLEVLPDLESPASNEDGPSLPDLGAANANGLTPLEQEVIATLLRPEHPVFAALRAQFATCSVRDRRFTGVGFFTKLVVSPEAPRAPVTGPRLILDDVEVSVHGLRHGGGFVLFVADGRLDSLEGYTFGEPWPQTVRGFAVSSRTPQTASSGHASDLEQAVRAFDPSVE